MRKQFCALLDLFFVMRPMLLIPVWSYFILGYYHGIASSQPQAWSIMVRMPYGDAAIRVLLSLPSRAAILVLAFSLLVGGIYVLNQIADIEADKRNRGFPLLARGVVTPRTAKAEATILFGVPLLAAMAVDWTAACLFALAIALGFAYCVRPMRWSGRPVLDFLSNAVGYGLITFVLGWHAGAPGQLLTALLRAAPYALLMAAGSIASTIPDMPGDQEDGKLTTSVWFGVRTSTVLSVVALVSAALLGWLERDAFVLISVVVALPFFLRLLWDPKPKNACPAYQVGGGALVLLSVAICPLFLLLSLFLFFITKMYFLKRHGVHYPQMGQ